MCTYVRLTGSCSLQLSSAELGGKDNHLLGGSRDLLRIENYKRLLGKSTEQLPQMESEVGPFRRESGSDGPELSSVPYQPHALLENPESETRWYFKYFLGKVHVNHLGYDADKSPFFLSVVPSDAFYRCILWRKSGNKRLCEKPSSNGKWPSAKSILEKFGVTKSDKNLKEVAVATIQKDLLTLEEQEGSVNFKFGVLYAKAGQRTDDEMFSNEQGSPAFSLFLRLLGDEILLQGWQLFRGGLDSKTNTTGTRSVYTVFEGHEIMFHVSTMLPYSVGNLQQLERKRHIGNDIVVIIFVDDGGDPSAALRSALAFNPGCMRSHFNHVFVLVTYDRKAESFRVVVQSAESVPTFAPALPPSGEFTDHVAFRDFLLAKLINGEKAAYCTPTFAEKRQRTLDLLLRGVEKKVTGEYRRIGSTPSLHSPNQNKKSLEKEQSFTDFGQRLKVEKIITGHHPTSQRTTVAPKKKNPWETVCIAEDFPYQITCGDACDDGTLIVTTQADGTYFIFKDGSYSLALDKAVLINQLVVAHRHQVLLLTTAYPKEANYLYAVPLKEFYSERLKMRSKPSLLPYLLPCTKGCHLFCTAPLDGQFLRIAVAIKNKVSMLAYKHPAILTVTGSPLTPLPSPHPLESFIKHRELSLQEVPVQMALLDERPSGKICVSYAKQSVLDAVDEISGSTQRIPHLAKSRLTTLCSVLSNGRNELLVGYNLTSQLITLHDGTAYNSSEIVWNAEPKCLVYMHPYVLAFTASTVEIRLASNGSLMQTIDVPKPHLFSMKGDVYFASPMLLPNCRADSSRQQLAPDVKMPKNIDKKGFTASDRFTESDGAHFIYKITLENMTGRRDSITSTSSVQFTQSTGHEDAISTTSIISEELPSDSSSLDFVHPSVDEVQSPPPLNFRVGDSPPPPPEGGERKKTSHNRRVWVYPSSQSRGSAGDSVFDSSKSVGGGGARQSDSDVQEHTLSSSPDSGVQDDFGGGGHFRVRTLAVVEPHTSPKLEQQRVAAAFVLP